MPSLGQAVLSSWHVFGQIHDHLAHAQELMKCQYDKGHCDVEFAVCDWVWFLLHQRIATVITDKSAAKLASNFYGPFRVEEHVRSKAYHLALPPKALIHNVYHVVSLKKYIGDSPQEQVQLPPIKRGQVLPVPAKVLCARLNRGTWEVSVKWFGRSQAETTWEDLEEFKGQIPKLLARGQTVSRGGRIVLWALSLEYNTRGVRRRQASRKQVRDRVGFEIVD